MPDHDLLNEDAPDVEDFLCCWLQPVVRAAVERRQDDPLPFVVVTRVAGEDDQHEGIDDPTIQLDIFDRAQGKLTASQAAKLTANMVHRRMMFLSRNTGTAVTMSGGVVANVDSLSTSMKPVREPYADERIVRYVARYQVGLSYMSR